MAHDLRVTDVHMAEGLGDEMREKLRDGDKPKHEQCGILFGDIRITGDRSEGKVTHVTYVVRGWLEVRNSSKKPTKTFKISGRDIMAALEGTDWTPDDIIGVVHTHPAGSAADPSMNDVLAIPENQVGIVLHSTTGSLTYYDMHNGFIQRERR